MKQSLFSIYDHKSETWNAPFIATTRAAAIRSFADVAKDKSHPIGHHPEDYALYEVGSWDGHTGSIEAHDIKEQLAFAQTLVSASSAGEDNVLQMPKRN